MLGNAISGLLARDHQYIGIHNSIAGIPAELDKPSRAQASVMGMRQHAGVSELSANDCARIQVVVACPVAQLVESDPALRIAWKDERLASVGERLESDDMR